MEALALKAVAVVLPILLSAFSDWVGKQTSSNLSLSAQRQLGAQETANQVLQADADSQQKAKEAADAVDQIPNLGGVINAL